MSRTKWTCEGCGKPGSGYCSGCRASTDEACAEMAREALREVEERVPGAEITFHEDRRMTWESGTGIKIDVWFSVDRKSLKVSAHWTANPAEYLQRPKGYEMSGSLLEAFEACAARAEEDIEKIRAGLEECNRLRGMNEVRS